MPLRVVALRIPQAKRRHGETEGRNSQTSELALFLVKRFLAHLSIPLASDTTSASSIAVFDSI